MRCAVAGLGALASSLILTAGLSTSVAAQPLHDAAAIDGVAVSGNFGPVWSDREAAALRDRLRAAVQHGLDPSPYLAMLDASASPSQRDLNRTRAALDYATALAKGVVDPHALFDVYTLPQDEIDLPAGLNAALAQGRVGPWLDGLAPHDAEYRALSAAYLALVGRSPPLDLPPIASGPVIRVGDTDPRRPQILASLVSEPLGTRAPDMAAPPSQGLVWTQEDADRLKAYQFSRGLAADGIVGPNVLAMLNMTPADKMRRLSVNLERLRWLQRSPPPTRIDVNIAASHLTYIVGDAPTWTTAVAPGRPGYETPQLQASFERLVLNPPWYVPASIVREEIDPKGPAYLRRHHMRRVEGRVIQSPGPWAALGQVKFDMQNRYAIYLHDTPAKTVFTRSERHVSHGCVRVEDALAFARRLADVSGEGDRFDRILSSGKTGVVPLSAAMPVRLIYKTATVSEDGLVTFRPDVYDWDVRIAAAMGLAAPSREGVKPITAAPLGP